MLLCTWPQKLRYARIQQPVLSYAGCSQGSAWSVCHPSKKETQILYLRFLNMKQTPRNGSAMLWIGSSWCSKPNNLHFWRLHITHLFLVIEEYGIGCTSVPAKSPFRPGSRPLLSFERGISRWSKRITPKWLRPPHWSCGDGWDGWKPMEIYGFVAPPLKKKCFWARKPWLTMINHDQPRDFGNFCASYFQMAISPKKISER